MLRVKIELIPDNRQFENFKPILLKCIDIKEDGSGSARWGNYKTKFYDTERAQQSTVWRLKQVKNLLYKDYYPVLLVYLAMKNYITDMENQAVSNSSRHNQVKEPVDYLEWKERRSKSKLST